MASNIKVLDVVLPHESAQRNDILRDAVWPVIRPEWTAKDVLEKVLSAGYVNSMSVYHTAEDAHKKHAAVVRVFRSHEKLDKRREMEFVKMQIASHMGCYPTIHAVLTNAVIYQYAPGRNLCANDLANPTVIKNVAAALAQFHWYDSTSLSLINRRGNGTDFKVEDIFMRFNKENYANRFTGNPDDTEEERKKLRATSDAIGKELEFVEQYLSDLDLPVTNSHNDFHNNNILYDDGTGHVTILDFEFSKEGHFAMYDLSYLFNMFRFAKFIEKMDLGTESVSEETKREWVSAYLRRKCELEGRDPASLSATEIDLWVTYLAITDPLMFFYGAVRCLPYIANQIPIPIKQMFEVNLKHYYERKATLEPLKEACLQLRAQLAQKTSCQK